MPLIKKTLELEIRTLLNQLKTQDDQEASINQFVSGLATAIDNYIKTATVNVVPGIPVQVVVPAGTGTTVGPGTGNLS